MKIAISSLIVALVQGIYEVLVFIPKAIAYILALTQFCLQSIDYSMIHRSFITLFSFLSFCFYSTKLTIHLIYANVILLSEAVSQIYSALREISIAEYVVGTKAVLSKTLETLIFKSSLYRKEILLTTSLVVCMILIAYSIGYSKKEKRSRSSLERKNSINLPSSHVSEPAIAAREKRANVKSISQWIESQKHENKTLFKPKPKAKIYTKTRTINEHHKDLKRPKRITNRSEKVKKHLNVIEVIPRRSRKTNKNQEKSLLFRTLRRHHSAELDTTKLEFKKRLNTLLSSSSSTTQPNLKQKTRKYKFKIEDIDEENEEGDPKDLVVNTELDDEYSKYRKMLKYGIPLKAVFRKMREDGIKQPSKSMLYIKRIKDTGEEEGLDKEKERVDFKSLDKYQKMKYFGIPSEAIERQKLLDSKSLKSKPKLNKIRKRSKPTERKVKLNKMRKFLMNLQLLWEMFLVLLGFTSNERISKKKKKAKSKDYEKMGGNKLVSNSERISRNIRMKLKKRNKTLPSNFTRYQSNNLSLTSGDPLINELKGKLKKRRIRRTQSEKVGSIGNIGSKKSI